MGRRSRSYRRRRTYRRKRRYWRGYEHRYVARRRLPHAHGRGNPHRYPRVSHD